MSEIDLNALPSNSNKAKEAEKAHVVEKVVTGKVSSRKKNFFKRSADALLADDMQSIKGYLISDVVVPAIRDTIVDLVENGIRMMVYGNTVGRRGRHSASSTAYVSYNGYYSSNQRSKPEPKQQVARSRDFDEFVFETKGDAEMVLDQMLELIDIYGQVTVNDFYDLIGKTGDFTDDRFGWTNLSTASTPRVKGGYIINLPRVQALK